MILVLSVIAAIFTILGAHPFTTYPFSLWLLSRMGGAGRAVSGAVSGAVAGGALAPAQAAAAIPLSAFPGVAICMSAFNEERVIAEKMEGLLAMVAHYPGAASIHVYVDGATDRTAQILDAYRSRADIVVSAERHGKSWGMAQLVARTTGELLLFTDANVMSGPDAITLLAAQFADPAVGLASARLRYNNPRESATSLSGAAYWEIEEGIKRIESATIGLVGVDGAMFAIRRGLYRSPPPQLIDDLYVSLSVLIAGSRIVSVESATVSERSAARAAEEFARKKRIACQAWNVHRALWRELRRMPPLPLYGYVSHRVMKWLTPAFVAVAVPAWIAVLCLTLGFAHGAGLVAGVVVMVAVGATVGFAPASLLVTTLYSFAGVGVGLVQSIATERTYTVWSPADSVRGVAGDGTEFAGDTPKGRAPHTEDDDVVPPCSVRPLMLRGGAEQPGSAAPRGTDMNAAEAPPVTRMAGVGGWAAVELPVQHAAPKEELTGDAIGRDFPPIAKRTDRI